MKLTDVCVYHQVGYANAPLCFCVWESVNGNAHQCAHVAPSVSMWSHDVQNVLMHPQTKLLVTNSGIT